MDKCIRLRKNNLCRLDLKPCKENCPLRKTKEEQLLYLDEVKSNECLWEIEVCRSMVKKLSNIFYKTNDISASWNNTGEIRKEQGA